MEQRRLGNSGLYVSSLSLGTMIFGETGSRGTPKEEALKMISAYIDAGGNHLDTANVYAGGQSEEILGQALKNGTRNKVTLATKVRFGASTDQHQSSGLGKKFIIDQLEQSLKRLNTDVIDLYYMHGWDPQCPIEESLQAFDDLVRHGKVRYIGVSNFKAWQIMLSQGISQTHGWEKFIAGQYQYSLVVRDIEYEFSSLFQNQGIGCMAWGPLGGGFLSGKYGKDHEPKEGRIAKSDPGVEEAWARRANQRNWDILSKVEQIAKSHGATIPQIALAWLLSQPMVSSVLLGARTLDQLKDNLKAAEITLTNQELEALTKVSTLPELYPYRMIQAYGME
jgi:aryl-alcohol dehydrogenase-like predicted oxidoreductase